MNQDIPSKYFLLQQLDSLNYSTRVKTMALMGREHGDSQQFHALLADLLTDGVYEGQLALSGAATAKNLVIIQAALRHRYVNVRRTATGLFAQYASGEMIQQEIVKLSVNCRLYLLHMIGRKNRTEVAEILLPFVNQTWGAREAAVLLQACSEETVEKYLPIVGHVIINWRELAANYLDVVAEYFKACLERAKSGQRCEVWQRFSSAMRPMCESQSKFVLSCAINYGTNELPKCLEKNMGILIHKYPKESFYLNYHLSYVIRRQNEYLV